MSTCTTLLISAFLSDVISPTLKTVYFIGLICLSCVLLVLLVRPPHPADPVVLFIVSARVGSSTGVFPTKDPDDRAREPEPETDAPDTAGAQPIEPLLWIPTSLQTSGFLFLAQIRTQSHGKTQVGITRRADHGRNMLTASPDMNMNEYGRDGYEHYSFQCTRWYALCSLLSILLFLVQGRVMKQETRDLPLPCPGHWSCPVPLSCLLHLSPRPAPRCSLLISSPGLVSKSIVRSRFWSISFSVRCCRSLSTCLGHWPLSSPTGRRPVGPRPDHLPEGFTHLLASLSRASSASCCLLRMSAFSSVLGLAVPHFHL
jgi:hypothetical protein